MIFARRPAARQPASPPPSKAGACFGPMRSSGPGRRSCSKTSSAAGSGTPSSPGQSPLYSPKSWGRGLTGSWSMPLARERGCSARNRPLWNNGVPAISRCVPGGSAVSCAVPPASSAREGGCCIPPAHLPRRKTNGRWGRSWSNTRISFWKTSGRLDSAALAFPRRRSPPSPCRKTALFPPPSPLNGAGVSCPRTGAKGISWRCSAKRAMPGRLSFPSFRQNLILLV